MSPEPRIEEDYTSRQVEAAHRVLVDLGQVLASYVDCLVIVGGWTPGLLLDEAEESHVGSIDVDMALDAEKLNDGRYADLLKMLLDTGRYTRGDKKFKFVTNVYLGDAEPSVQVDVEFLAPKEVKLKSRKSKLIKDFRVLQVEGADVAFRKPVEIELPGKNIRGATNTVQLRVVSLPDFLIMKAFAIGGRDKPKDTYDLCYCLEYFPEGMSELAWDWKERKGEKHVDKAVQILRSKFAAIDSFGPQQFVEFHKSKGREDQEMQARRAFELVQRFLNLLA